MKRLAILALAAFALLVGPAHAESGGWFGGSVEIPDRQGDAIVAAGSVTIAGRVTGDAFVAAGQTRVNGEVGGDARVLAGEYHQAGGVAGKVAVASGKVDIDGAIGDDLYVASEDVHIGSDARIGRNARIAGQDVMIKGRIDGDLEVQGEEVALDAQVGGNVTIRARHITLGPDTTIEGALNWKAASAPDIASDAIIARGVSGKLVHSWEQPGGWTWGRPWGAAPRAAIFAGEAAARLMVALSAFLLGLGFVLAAPAAADSAVETLRKRWPAALALGALIAGLTPFVAVMLIITIVGIPLGLFALLSYPLMLLLGYAAGAAMFGGLVLPGKTPRARAIAVGAGVLALTALAFLPFVGFLAGLAATLTGLGVWAASWRTPRAAS